MLNKFLVRIMKLVKKPHQETEEEKKFWQSMGFVDYDPNITNITFNGYDSDDIIIVMEDKDDE